MGSDVMLTLLAMLICLLVEGFFSGSEIGVVSADRIKLRHAAAKGSRGARLALGMLENPEWLLSTTLVGTNIAVVANTTLATGLMIDLFGPAGSLLAVALVAPLIWVFGEIVPKSIFQQKSDVLTPRVIFALKFFSYLFFPLLLVFSGLARLLARLVGGRPEKNPFTLREQIVTMMEMRSEQGDIEPHEQTMIRRLFNFGETTAGEVMVPLLDVVGVDQDASCGDARRLAVDSAHKRLPVYAGRVDEVVGVLDCLELLGLPDDGSIREFIRPVDYVPASKSIQDLLLEMRREGQMLSVVVDEFGGAEGVVTIEDIMEEVVEDLRDEFDEHESPTEWIRRLRDGDYLVSARVDLDQLSDKLRLDLPRNRYNTLAGFLLAKVRDVPVPGSTVEYHGIRFTIMRGTPRAIQEVRIRW